MPLASILKAFDFTNSSRASTITTADFRDRNPADVVAAFSTTNELRFNRDEQRLWAEQKLHLTALEPTALLQATLRDASLDANEHLDSIKSLVANSEAIDAILYLTKKRHRDHSLHMVHVALAGLRLLACHLRKGPTLARRYANVFTGKSETGDSFSEEQIAAFWTVAALIHDIGYPLSQLASTRQQILLALGTGGTRTADIISSILSQYPNLYHPDCIEFVFAGAPDSDQRWRRVVKQLADFVGDNGDLFALLAPHRQDFPGGEMNHGLLSALNFCFIIRDAWGQLDPSTRLLLSDAIVAAALHDANIVVKRNDLPPLQINFAERPYAALLKLCDELHEWDRPLLANEVPLPEGEVQQVRISPVHRIDDTIYLEDSMSAIFEFKKSPTLQISGWEYRYFSESKQVLQHIGLPFKISARLDLPAT